MMAPSTLPGGPALPRALTLPGLVVLSLAACAEIAAPDSWLSLIGLPWLEQGETTRDNRLPVRVEAGEKNGKH